MGFDWQTCSVITSIDQQSPDIAQGVDENAGLFKEQGAGDQGLMFGFEDATALARHLDICLAVGDLDQVVTGPGVAAESQRGHGPCVDDEQILEAPDVRHVLVP